MATKRRAQYKTLKALHTAFQDGTLPRKDVRLILDNDCSYLWDRHDADALQSYGWNGDAYHPDRLLREALDLLGIPWEDA